MEVRCEDGREGEREIIGRTRKGNERGGKDTGRKEEKLWKR